MKWFMFMFLFMPLMVAGGGPGGGGWGGAAESLGRLLLLLPAVLVTSWLHHSSVCVRGEPGFHMESEHCLCG